MLTILFLFFKKSVIEHRLRTAKSQFYHQGRPFFVAWSASTKILVCNALKLETEQLNQIMLVFPQNLCSIPSLFPMQFLSLFIVKINIPTHTKKIHIYWNITFAWSLKLVRIHCNRKTNYEFLLLHEMCLRIGLLQGGRGGIPWESFPSSQPTRKHPQQSRRQSRCCKRGRACSIQIWW